MGVEDTAESTDVIFDVVKFSPESEKLPKTEKQIIMNYILILLLKNVGFHQHPLLTQTGWKT